MAAKSRPPTPFALVIGINTYEQPYIPDLQGAVTDADAFENFLKTKLLTSPKNITSLRDRQATRAAIIGSFQKLITNSEIQKDDPIIIYYAGHGAQVNKPKSWIDWPTTQEIVEIMCPYDIRNENPPIPGIPDRTIASLLNDLSTAKGDNITLILDCCCSAGLSRHGRKPIITEGEIEYHIRQAFSVPIVPDGCDAQIISGRSAVTSGSFSKLIPPTPTQGFHGKYHGSHVLLAACGASQVAREMRMKGAGAAKVADGSSASGVFTRRLVNLLTQANLRQLTYSSLMHELEMPKWQTPHCEGKNVSRCLFDKVSLGADPAYIVCRATDGENPVLLAGEAQGIQLKSKYSLHPFNVEEPALNKPMCKALLVVTKVAAYASKLQFDSPRDAIDLPDKPFYAKKVADPPATDALARLTITSNDVAWLKQAFKYVRDQNIVIVENPTGKLPSPPTTDLTYTKQPNGIVSIHRRDPFSNKYVGARLFAQPKATDHGQLVEVARRAQHYKHHFSRVGQNIEGVTIELFLLGSRGGGGDEWSPTSLDLIRQGGNIAEVQVGREYGMQMRNGTDTSLYCYVLYFDPRELSIDFWFKSAMGAGTANSALPNPDASTYTDPSLPAHSTLTIGYGSSNTEPWTFELGAGDNIDVGFFKVYFTDRPTDLDMLLQRDLTGGTRVRAKPEVWGTKTITVVQKERRRKGEGGDEETVDGEDVEGKTDSEDSVEDEYDDFDNF